MARTKNQFKLPSKITSTTDAEYIIKDLRILTSWEKTYELAEGNFKRLKSSEFGNELSDDSILKISKIVAHNLGAILLTHMKESQPLKPRLLYLGIKLPIDGKSRSITEIDIENIISFASHRQSKPEPFSKEDWEKVVLVFQDLQKKRKNYVEEKKIFHISNRNPKKVTDVSFFTDLLVKIATCINDDINPATELRGLSPERSTCRGANFNNKVFELTHQIIKIFTPHYPISLTPKNISSSVRKALNKTK